MPRKNFITGGGGFIGSHLVDSLLARGEAVTVFDIRDALPDNLAHHQGKERFHYITGDIRAKDTLKNVLSEEYDRIFHLAAIVGVENYCEQPLKTLDVNFGGTRNIVDVALSHDIKVIFASSSEVFGKNPRVPWEEDADRVLGPTSIHRWSYSTSKAACEHMLFAIHDKYDLPIVIVRFFNAYGPRQNPIFVVPAMIQRVLADKPPLVFGEGDQTRCFTFVKDAVEGTLEAAGDPSAEGEAFNIGNNKETTIKDLADKILHVAGKDLQSKHVSPNQVYDSYEDLDRRIPAVKKAKEHLNWQATTSLDEGLQKTLQWYKKARGNHAI